MSSGYSAIGDPGAGAVVTSNRYATEAGAEVLRKGGSAVDALVAAAAVQCVVENGSTTIAGLWYSNSFDAESGQTTTVSGKVGPAEAESYDYDWQSPEAFEGRAMPVPGWPAGAYRTWEQGGRLPWWELLEPAIAFAENGFEVDSATYLRVRIHPGAARTAEGRELWLRDGSLVEPGDRVRQPALARTLRDLAEGGPAAFYEGAFAEHYVAASRKRGGLLTMADMARWPERAVDFTAALEGDYCGYQVVTGGGLLVYALHLCQAANLGAIGYPESVYAQVRILEETLQATREYSPETHDRFVDRGFAEERIDEALSGPLRPVSFDLFWSNTNTLLTRDADGNVAWLVHSINTPELFGAGIIVDGAYAVRAVNEKHGREGDLLAPGLFSKIALYRDGKPYAVAASPGYSCVHSPIAFTVGLAQRGLDPLAAMGAPRFALPSPLSGNRQMFESHYPPEVFAHFEERGLPYFECTPSSTFGRVGAIVVDGDRVHAVHDMRGDPSAAVVD